MRIIEGFFDFLKNNKVTSSDVVTIEEVIFDAICEYSENENFTKNNEEISPRSHSDTYRYVEFESDKFTIDYFSDSNNSDYILLTIIVSSLDPWEKDIEGMIKFVEFVKNTFTSYDIIPNDRIKGLLKRGKYSFITGDILIKIV